MMTAVRRRGATCHPERRSTLWLAALILVAACGSDPTGPEGSFPTDADQAVFVTSDIENFWRAYDAGGASGTTSAFQTEYLDRASPGLRDFIASRNLTAASLSQMVRAYPRYFASIRANTLRLSSEATVLGRVRAGYGRLKEMYSAAVFPPVTFLIGRFSTGGTASQSGMLIGTEFFATGPSTPLDELGPFQRDNVKPLDSLPIIIAHEHVHILQARATGITTPLNQTLLRHALLEGSADFIGELVSGGNLNARLRAYAIPREAALWAEFQSQMNGTDVSRWLYNQGSTTGDRPGDLGYFIGYRIAQAYYDRTSDKRAAVRAIIEITNAQQFLSASGYAPSGNLSRQVVAP
jgi:hypothetical protein